MKNTNKPQWLIDAEKDINEFHETKHGKMTEKDFAKYNRNVNGRIAAIASNPNISIDGGKKRAEQFTSDSQKYAASCRDKDKLKKSALKGAINSAINKKIHTEYLKNKLYDLISLDKFTVYDLETLLVEFKDFKDLQMFRIYLRDTSKYEVIGVLKSNKPGPGSKIYRKI